MSAAIALQWLTLNKLLWLALLILPSVFLYARRRFTTLLRRARWLLLSLALLFCFATPGLSLPTPYSSLGLTWEGLEMAATHALRLSLLLALLAALQERLSIPALVSGLYQLLAPLGQHPLRHRFAIRLLLVLDYLEQGNLRFNWREGLNSLRLPSSAETSTETSTNATASPAATLQLQLTPLQWRDYLLILLVFTGLSVLAWQHLTH